MAEINEELRRVHLEQFADDPAAVRLYDQLCAVVAARPEGIDDAAQHLVAQVAELERIRSLAREDVNTNGLTKNFTNGRQRLRVDNKSVGLIMKAGEQQRKLMAELRITPASRRDMQQLGMFGDDFDDF